jgi:hypothetical protein
LGRVYSGEVKEIIVLYKDFKGLVSDLSDSGLDPLKCAKRLFEESWFTVKLTAVTRELSKVLSIIIVFVGKNNRLRSRNIKRRQKLEESQKLEEKIDKKKE